MFDNALDTSLAATLTLSFILTILGLIRIFSKAQYPTWFILIPILNMLTIIKISKSSLWLFWLLFIPVLNIIIYSILFFRISKQFGKNDSFSLCTALLPFIYLPILGFGTDKYSKGNKTESVE